MISAVESHRINNVAARVVWGELFFHPDCLAENPPKGLKEEDVSIDHEYCGGDGRFTSWDDECVGCGEILGDSGGVQPDMTGCTKCGLSDAEHADPAVDHAAERS